MEGDRGMDGVVPAGEGGREEEDPGERDENGVGRAGPLGSFHTPIYSTKTRGLASPWQGSRRPRRGRGGKTGLAQGSVSRVQAYGSSRDVTSGMSCALR